MNITDLNYQLLVLLSLDTETKLRNHTQLQRTAYVTSEKEQLVTERGRDGREGWGIGKMREE